MPPKKAAASKPVPAKKAASTDAAPLKKRVKATAAASEVDEVPKKAAPKATKPAASAKQEAAPASKAKAAAKAKPASTKKSTAAAPKKAAEKPDGSDKENEVEAPVKAPVKANTKRKRTPVEEVDDLAAEEEEAAKPAPAKKARKSPTPEKPAAAQKAVAPPQKKFLKIGKIINHAPTAPLDVYVFGEGTSGELGLGSRKVDGKKPIDVKRPRLNTPNLSSGAVGVVQLDTGGMHVAALTKDNKIYTWGVNDQGALGRDTTWDGGLRDVDDEDDDDEDEDDTGMNPHESTPAPIDSSALDPEIRWVQVVASDSATFALTEDGRVYGWGTFRGSEGIIGFSEKVEVQKTPALIPDLKDIRQLAAGANHILALDGKGKVLAWGSGQQNQLGRKVFEGHAKHALRPASVGTLPLRGSKAVAVACGSYHSFALDQQGRVFAWGLNNYAELGIADEAGENDAAQLKPRLVETLQKHKIASIAGGMHHSVASTDDGKLLTWGRIDGHQVGLPMDTFNEDNAIFDEYKKPRILTQPTVVPDVPAVKLVAAGADHNFAITTEGQVYSWGFSANYQTGQGTTDDIEVPTLIDNTAIRGKKLTFAGAGGQYSVLASEAQQDTPMVNGNA